MRGIRGMGAKRRWINIRGIDWRMRGGGAIEEEIWEGESIMQFWLSRTRGAFLRIGGAQGGAGECGEGGEIDEEVGRA